MPATPADPRLGVVIVNFDSGEHLRSCLAALEHALAGLSAEVVIVDNASTDSSLAGAAEIRPDARIIRNHSNRGYGRACNQAMAATVADQVIFLNPDTIPASGCLAAMVEALGELPQVGALGPRIVNSDGTLYPSGRVVPSLKVALGHAFLGSIWPENPYTRAYHLADWDHQSQRSVDWISGAAMLVRREAFLKAGGFDEGFFMYVEDVDLCDRIRKAGYSVVYFPQAQMIHHAAGSTRRTPFRMIRHHHISLMRYAYNKTKGTPTSALLPLIDAALAGRMVMSWIQKAFETGVRHSRAPKAPAHRRNGRADPSI